MFLLLAVDNDIDTVEALPPLAQDIIINGLVRSDLGILGRKSARGIVVAGDEQINALTKDHLQAIFPIRRERFLDHDRKTGRQQIFDLLDISTHAEFRLQPTGIVAHVINQLLNIHITIITGRFYNAGDIILIALPAIVPQIESQGCWSAVIPILLIFSFIISRRIENSGSGNGGGNDGGRRSDHRSWRVCRKLCGARRVLRLVGTVDHRRRQCFYRIEQTLNIRERHIHTPTDHTRLNPRDLIQSDAQNNKKTNHIKNGTRWFAFFLFIRNIFRICHAPFYTLSLPFE